jgi:serine/threonine-protein kinase RIO1
LKKQPKRTKRKSAQWYEKEYAALDKLYNRGISREEYERRVKIITDDLNGVADDDR